MNESAIAFAKRIRGHWGVENRFIMLDMLPLERIVLESVQDLYLIYGRALTPTPSPLKGENSNIISILVYNITLLNRESLHL